MKNNINKTFVEEIESLQYGEEYQMYDDGITQEKYIRVPGGVIFVIITPQGSVSSTFFRYD